MKVLGHFEATDLEHFNLVENNPWPRPWASSRLATLTLSVMSGPEGEGSDTKNNCYLA